MKTMETDYNDYNDFEDEEEEDEDAPQKRSNALPFWGNDKTMNLNTLLLTNIQSSQYFKVKLYALKTYHEVLDEIYYQVGHLEPWEKGSRKTAGQTGMCGGVRGVGAGGIVSTAYCILYKLFTLRLTRKQLNGLVNNADSPYIRGLGFMYIRYTQPPADLWDWLEPYLDDEEEVDVRAGGGQMITMGAMCRHLLTKLDWHATLFPRVPVPIQKELEKKIGARDSAAVEEATRERLKTNQQQNNAWQRSDGANQHDSDNDRNKNRQSRDASRDKKDTNSKDSGNSRPRGSRDNSKDRDRNRHKERNSRDRDVYKKTDKRSSRDRRTSKDRDRRSSKDRDRRISKDRRGSQNKDKRVDRDMQGSKDRYVSRDKDRRGSSRDRNDRRRSRDRDDRHSKHKRDRHRSRSPKDFSSDLLRERDRVKRARRSRSRSRDRHHRK